MAVRQRDFIRIWSPETPRERVQRLARNIAREYGVDEAEMLVERRFPELTAARFALYACLRSEGFSLPQIGRMVGRDHTTVLHGIRVHTGRIAA